MKTNRDEIGATMADVVRELNTGERTETYAKRIGIGEKKLRAILRDSGYTYSNKTKRWSYTGDGVEPSNVEISRYAARATPSPSDRGGINTGMQSKGNRNMTNTINQQSFTPEQISVLNHIVDKAVNAVRYESAPNDNSNDNNNDNNNEPLHFRVMALPRGDAKRKTIIIDSGVGIKFDEFADKVKMNKSDLMSIALIDLMEKYDVNKF